MATAGAVNKGAGGGGGGNLWKLLNLWFRWKSGIVILKYGVLLEQLQIGAGLTGSTTSAGGGYKITTITAGTGNVSWS
jgi:hypothetical protein